MIPIFNFRFINVSSAYLCDEPPVAKLVQPKPLHMRKSVPRLVREQGQMYAAPPDMANFRLKTLDLLRAHAEARGSGDFSSLWSGQNPTGSREIPLT